MNESFQQIREDQLEADAVKTIKDIHEIPRGFYQRPDGLVSPERLRNPEPEITICGHVDEEMFKDTSKSLQKITEGNSLISGLRVNFSSFAVELLQVLGYMIYWLFSEGSIMLLLQ